LEEIMKNYSDVKTLEDNTDQKSRVLPIVLVGGVVVGGLAVGGAAAAVAGLLADKW
jgi:hypothetical protein